MMLHKIIWTQFKLIIFFGLLLSAILLLGAPVFVGLKYLDETASAVVLERYVSLVGIILVVPLFFPEQDKNISEVIEAKYTSHNMIIFCRLVLSILIVFALISLMALIMYLGECSFPVGKYILGTFVSALALGSLGFAGAGITNNIIAGYLVSVCYYILNMGLGKKLGNFYLFSMSRGSFDEKYYLLGAALLIIVTTFVVIFINSKKR